MFGSPFPFSLLEQGWKWSFGVGRNFPEPGNMAGSQMNRDVQAYNDRFGNEWHVLVESKRGEPKRVSFTCDEFELTAVEDDTTDQSDLSTTWLKDLFCSAERVFVYGNEKWYVGFRSRIGRGGRPQGGVQTRFRSESGEERYSKRMLQFRHMPHAALCKQLAAAMPAARPRA